MCPLSKSDALADGREAVVYRLPLGGAFLEDDAALVQALLDRDPGAAATLYDRFAPHVQRVLARVMGADAELPDLLQDVFVQAYGSVRRLRNPSSLKAWLTSIAVFTARGRIRRRSLTRLVRVFVRGHLPERVAPAPSGEVVQALRETYVTLGRLPIDERIAFALRVIDGMDLGDVAAACGVSLATIKRRLSRAQARFVAMAEQNPVLCEWLDGSAE